MTPDQFPILLSTAKSPEYFARAIRDVAEGLADGKIRNTVLQDAKHTLSRVVDNAWKKTVSEPFFYSGEWKNQPLDVQDLSDSITIMGLHDVISTSKKVGRSKAQGPAVDAMRAYVAEVLPLAMAVASLKDKIVKGRAPSTGPSKPVNPNKIVKTCPCCFRQIAVTGGRMVHHGYERPGSGYQTASCPGIKFPPLQISTEGLEWLIGAIQGKLAATKEAYRTRGDLEFILVPTRTRPVQIVKVEKGTSDWSREFRHHVAGLEMEMRMYPRELESLGKELEKWKQWHLDAATAVAA